MELQRRRLSSTPCPVAGTIQYRPRDSISTLDDTTQVDFTKEFGGSLYAKPRRRASLHPQRTLATHFVIHEDQDGWHPSAEHAGVKVADEKVRSQQSVLSKAPQRIGRRVSFAPGQNVIEDRSYAIREIAVTESIRPPRPSIGPILAVDGANDEDISVRPLKAHGRMLKPARRGTIYIPSDDTTMPTMYMGVFLPPREANVESSETKESNTGNLTGIAAQMAQKKRSRMSLAAGAKRIPLEVTKPINQIHLMGDVAGRNTGKENVPPLSSISNHSIKATGPLFDLQKQDPKRRNTSGLRRSSIFQAQRTVQMASQNASYLDKSQNSISPLQSSPGSRTGCQGKAAWNSGIRKPLSKVLPPKTMVKPRPTSVVHNEALLTKPKVPTKLIMPSLAHSTMPIVHPILEEDLVSSEMYEDSWLSYQEVAIAQLVNNLFTASRYRQRVLDDASVRFGFLDLYQHDRFTLLFRRLQASLLYGALSIPNEILSTEAIRLQKDLGFKVAFVNLWTQTFDSTALRISLEVVVARVCKNTEQGLRDFLERFLIRNEDSRSPPDQSQTYWAYQRTFLRSLMIIRLLDEVKVRDDLFPQCLFLPTSPYKCLVTFLQALCRMLNPAVGDVVRALSHVDYQVSHKQYTLEEFDYGIENIAVDLRDGVRLARLVELLLYPSACPQLARERDFDTTATVLMPGGEVLSVVNGLQSWPLSQHLRFPCLSRATKLYNVQIALSALKGVVSMRKLTTDITAEDVVDGFREKTVALLWGLTGKWGLGGLIDWNDAQREITRLHRRLPRSERFAHEEEQLDIHWCEAGFETHKTLLKRWATAVGATRNLRIKNLTTSFADGKAFEAIVDEYEQYLLDRSLRDRPPASLEERLTRLGCSHQFAQLFSGPPGSALPTRIFDRDFTLASLAFLCSRLLSASRRSRAAITIQQAWRRRILRLEAMTQLVSGQTMELATGTNSNLTQQVDAKTKIWKAWKTYQSQQANDDNMRPDGSNLDVWLSL